jgi:hypothetical protein
LRNRGIKPVIAKRRTEHGTALAKIAGALNVLMPCCITSVAFVFVLSAVLTFTAHS